MTPVPTSCYPLACVQSKLQTARRLSSDEVVAAGGYLRAHCHPKRFPVAHSLKREDWAPRLLAVREDHVVVSKPPGLQVCRGVGVGSYGM